MSNDKTPLKVALIGLGAVSHQYYGPALADIASAESISVEALYDPVAGRGAQLQEQFVQATLIDSWDTLLSKKIDLAIVASPAHCHAEQSIALLDAGAAVLCEKPMACDLASAQKMVAASARTGKLLAVSYLRRFFPAAQAIRQLIGSTSMGRPLSFTFSEGSPFGWPVRSTWPFEKKSTRGGVLLEYGCHLLDLVYYWFGLPDSIDYADDAMGGLESNCTIGMQFATGLSGTVRLSRDLHLQNRYVIELERGTLVWEVNQSNQLDITWHDIPFLLKGVLHDKPAIRRADSGIAATFHQSFTDLLRNVFAAVRNENKLAVSGEEGLFSQELIERCYTSRRLLDMDWMTDAELREAHRLSGQA